MLRYKNIIIAGVVVFICIVVFHAGAEEIILCKDIKTIEFRNFRMAVPDRGVVQFKNGTALSSDGEEKSDWKINLIQDEVFHPSVGAEVRLLRITSNHLTGSGSWDHVFIYRCREGNLERIFQEEYLFGVKINKISAGELLFISGEWTVNDPMCCPSKESLSTYSWDNKVGTYKLEHKEYRSR
jgi:hypothetical protein